MGDEWNLPRGTGTPQDDSVALTEWLAHSKLKRLSDPDSYPRIILSSDRDELGNGLFLGLTEKGEPVSIIDDRHCITVAGSRAGKGRSAIVPNLLLWKGSAVVIDPKGENASLTARHRAERLGQHVVVLDPFSTVGESAAPYRRRFNPLLELDPLDDEFVDEAVLLADSIVATRADTRDPHWDESARELIKGLILHVRTIASRRPDQANLLTLRRVLTSPARLQAALIEMSAGLSAAFGVSAAAAESFLAKPENERMSVLSNARRHTEFLDSPAMARCLSWEGALPDENLDRVGLGHLKRAWHTDRPCGMTIYLCLPARHMLTYGR